MLSKVGYSACSFDGGANDNARPLLQSVPASLRRRRFASRLKDYDPLRRRK